ncbi:accessory gene regulator B family protein [Clostridium sp. 'deep sea']|uniref:accessory gene regulator ArgB-like protein n=1 Tax=Clostridium sp. 'deep sea' TaxID=2779445 RepID=UPI00189677BE|nr:accessory gene regulator B family protein [Clostridium sp. 'deep sea']QOR33866.1 accessory gene regulator B family protein [Clostridium sp. 'deep sea']
MKLRENLCKWVIAQIKTQNTDLSETRVAELEYGFHCFYTFITKISFIIILSIILKMTPEILTVIITFLFVRSFAGGIHAESSLACLVTTTAIYFGVSFAAIHIHIPFMILISMAVFAIVLIAIFAPADVANKPIRGIKHKRKLKTLSVIFAIVFTTIAFFMRPVLQNAILLSIFVESIMVTPLAYKLTNTLGGEHYEEIV